MGEATDRPATAGTDHKRRGAQSPESAALLARYRVTLRAELTAALDALEAKPKPKLPERVALLRLARQLAAELGSGDDPSGPAVRTTAADATRGRAPRLTRAERARLE